MADFNTHIVGATLVSGLLSTACLGADVITPSDAISLWAMGTLGGVLPDIDSDHSHALRLVFGLMGVGVAATALSVLADHLSIVELWFTCVALYLLVRHGASRLFAKFTVHRGIFHSLLASMAMGLVVVHVARWAAGRGPLMAWMMGFFAFVGCLVHLLLDEMYSVDLIQQRVKRSFGTAFKMFERRSPKASAVALLSVVALGLLAPSPDRFARFLFSGETYRRIGDRLLPNDGWFQAGDGVMHPRWRTAVRDEVPEYLREAVEVIGEEGDGASPTPVSDAFEEIPRHVQPTADGGIVDQGDAGPPPTGGAPPKIP